VCSGVDPVHQSIAVGVANALLLPILLVFLHSLARSELPEDLKLKGSYKYVVAVIFLITSALGLYSRIVGALG